MRAEVRTPTNGHVVDLPIGRTVVGRGDTTDLVLDDGAVSRTHAAFTLTSDGLLSVEDLGSRNGTRVDGQQLLGSTRLHPGSIVQLGSSEIEIMQESTELPITTEREAVGVGDWVQPASRGGASASANAAGHEAAITTMSSLRGTGRGQETISGIARDVDSQRSEYSWLSPSRSRQVLSFRLDAQDSTGAPTTIPVEMRGSRFVGHISEGEAVTALGRRKDGIFMASRLFSETSQSWVTPKGIESGKPLRAALVVMTALLIVVAVGAFLLVKGLASSDAGLGGPSADATMPDLRGRSVDYALGQLSDLGFDHVDNQSERNCSVPLFDVIRTDPPAGTHLDASTVITVVASDGCD